VATVQGGSAAPAGVPYSLGAAKDWMPHASSLGIRVDGTPSVGSVAWWDAGQGVDHVWRADAVNGHVAYVVRVKSPTDVVVAEDNCCSGPLDIREVWAGDAVWPGAFLHFPGSVVPPVPPPAASGAGLFRYDPANGASWVEFADGSGGWNGVRGPQFSPGWNVYPGILG
jgi:surface antigen